MVPQGLAASAATLASLFSEDGDDDGRLARAVEVVRALVGGAVLVGVTLGTSGSARVVAVTDDRARRLAEARLVDDARSPEPPLGAAAPTTLRVDDLADPALAARAPRLAAAATVDAIRTALIVPLIDGDAQLGTLDLYAEAPGGIDPDVELAAEVLAQLIASGLATGRSARRSRTEIDQLRLALESRDVIGQAKGILMATHRIDADAAFDLLRRASQSRNEKLRDLAELVARTGELPDDGRDRS